MDKISIIIPAYNVENYIDKCIESIINQTYENIEIIIINDGSTDDTRKICEEFKKKDNRIIVINKENSGVSIARNIGLKAITGKYIAFVDSDDWIEKDYCETMYYSMIENNVDLVMCGRVNEIKATKRFNSGCGLPDGYYKVDEIISEVICPQRYKIAITPHSKLFKASIIIDNLYFQEDLKYDEDYIFNINYLYKASSVMSIGSKFLYHYRTNPTSITNTYRKDMWENKLKIDDYARQLTKQQTGPSPRLPALAK
jgi:glycosyltransferase involved in cell wall biosynthesis